MTVPPGYASELRPRLPGLDRKLQVVLIEDDSGDALMVRDMLDEVEPDMTITWVRSLAEAEPVLDGRTRCVLLDLQLPDATDFVALEKVLAAAPRAAVVVLTGFADSQRGLEAVARGAQDYLNKSQVEPELLSRAVRYAIERRVAEDTARELARAETRAAENTRLERGLLPVPLLHDKSIAVVQRYRPGRDRALLGGDFYDVVECADGTLYAVIGDVSGHGPDEAALGVCLRVAWRTLILAGTDEERILPLTAEVLVHERSNEETFATACMVRIDIDRKRARVYLAGHPSPILLGPVAADAPTESVAGPPLGVLPDITWAPAEFPLPEGWRMLLYTDGLIEGGSGRGGADRLGVDGLRRLLDEVDAAGPDPGGAVERLIGRAQELNAGALTDDLAVVVLSRGDNT
ncbi:MAG TPA: SpoIIE family protein phosphatase [Sporichthya sp.]|nr:SpoIIE family protein phosphatase [Sporichthya sp.]